MSRPQSPWSFRLATVSGIPIRVHFTFLLLLAWIGLPAGKDAPRAIGIVVAVFACVLLHELGHALTALKCGIGIRDITLYPIGGVAMLTARPKPKQEFWITIAGPAVNLAIVAVLAPIVWSTGQTLDFTARLGEQSLVVALLEANLFLFGFNMIPAFPMDGGRILRAVLAMRIGETKATGIAAGIGQFLAVVLFFLGVFGQQIVLMIIAAFVFLGAGQEVASAVGHSLTANKLALDAMMTRFRTLSPDASLSEAANLVVQGWQQAFPVMLEGKVLGLLGRDDLAVAMTANGPDSYVGGAMRRDFRAVLPNTPLDSVLEMFAEDRAPILVMVEERLLGIITVENLGEFMMLERARRDSA
jgi:Zn-dependent protease